MKSIEEKIITRIKGKGRGYSFSSKDFLDLGSRDSADKALSNLAQAGIIRRIQRGLYDYPKINPALGGDLSPDYDQVAHAIARKMGNRIQASGAWATNLLGLSTQVPAKIVYLTDGISRTIRICNQKIELKHVGPRALLTIGQKSSLVVQALRYLGKGHIDKEVIHRLRRQLSDSDRKRLLNQTRYTEDWIYDIVKKIATKQVDNNG